MFAPFKQTVMPRKYFKINSIIISKQELDHLVGGKGSELQMQKSQLKELSNEAQNVQFTIIFQIKYLHNNLITVSSWLFYSNLSLT